ncbi:hypothetical protein CONLIGDRAFT_708875 [Coniochaeta ligniaria NRRL 30616]|uniref:Uncharacterized protein n=1 Tax=Coniochaeta ligniaria NRRL 30616 TaxID=1408157 RepID=A0A1J7J878_9PEZI|nr:hypothetical protein CONLIGDRAFT_708875 [Coniochaeta ligniaria NRRL 30616]
MDDQLSSPTTNTVGGMNIFWTILGLSLACSLHPLGSAGGFSRDLTRYVRVLPFSSALDVLFFIYEYLLISKSDGWSFRKPVMDLATSRCRDTLGLRPPADVEQTLQVEDGGEQESTLVLALAFFALDIRSRLIQNALVVFLYTKMCGYHGLPRWFAIATIYFGSWVLMEIFLLFAYGFRVMPHTRLRAAFTAMFPHTAAGVPRQAATSSPETPDARSSPPSASRSRNSPTQRLFRILSICAIVAQVLQILPLTADALVRRVPPATLEALFGAPMFGFCMKHMGLAEDILTNPGKLGLLYLPAILAYVFLVFLELPICFPFFALAMAAGLLAWFAILALALLPAVTQARVYTVILLVGFALSCTVFYDPTGTAKEPWTENLG